MYPNRPNDSIEKKHISPRGPPSKPRVVPSNNVLGPGTTQACGRSWARLLCRLAFKAIAPMWKTVKMFIPLVSVFSSPLSEILSQACGKSWARLLRGLAFKAIKVRALKLGRLGPHSPLVKPMTFKCVSACLQATQSKPMPFEFFGTKMRVPKVNPTRPRSAW